MPILKLNSALSTHKAQNFGSKQAEVCRLDDEELYSLASYGPRNRISEVSKNIAKTVFIGVPLADSFVSGFTHNGQLSSKLAKTASTLGKWGAVFATGLAVFGMKNAINKKSETLDNFDKKYRFLSLGIDFAALYGAFSLLTNGVSKAGSFVKKALPSITKAIKTDIANPLKAKLNGSVVNLRGIKSYEKFVSKHPHYNAAGRAVSLFLAPAIVIAAVLRYNKEIRSAQTNFENNLVQLKIVNDVLPEKQTLDEIDAE